MSRVVGVESTLSLLQASFLGLVAGLCIVLALPPFSNVLFIWFFPLPLLWVFARADPVVALTAAYICGLVSMNQATYGLLGYERSIWWLVFLVSPLWSLMPLASLIWMRRIRGQHYTLMYVPVAWVAMQTLLLEFGRLPLDIAVVFTRSLTYLQLASLFGSTLLTFLVILAGALATRGFLYLQEQESGRAIRFLLMGLSVPAGSYMVGAALLDEPSEPCMTRVDVAQPLIPTGWSRDGGLDPALRQEVNARFGRYLQLATETDARFLIWPEGAGAFISFRVGDARERLADFALRNNKHLFVTALDYDKRGRQFNTLFSIRPIGELARYNKMNPIPFAEKRLTPGDRYGNLQTRFGSAGALICFDVCFPDLVRAVGAKGAAFFVVSTSDMVFGYSNLSELHLAVSTLRAVENRTSVVHAANGGPSAIIDPFGRLTSRSQLMSETMLNGCVAKAVGPSIFVRFGYLFPYLMIAILLYQLIKTAKSGCTATAGNQPPLQILRIALVLIPVMVVTLFICALNAWLVGLKTGADISIKTVANSLQPHPVQGPQARILPSTREVWGADALARVFNYYGLQIGLNELLEPYNQVGYVLAISDLRNEALRRGFHAELVELSRQQIDQEIMPLLVGMKGGRVAMLVRLTDAVATLYEHNFGFGSVERETFDALWNGEVLRIRPP